MAVKSVGARDVITAGSVIAPANDDVVFQMGDLTFRVVFESLDGSLGGQVVSEMVDRELRIRIQNLSNASPISWANQVAVLDGRTLTLALAAQAVGSGDDLARLVTYTFTSGGEPNG
jgi:hypothetical protein